MAAPPPRHGKAKASGSSSSGSSASRKEQRIAQVRQARTIATQPSSSSTPGPSTLPSQLDLDPYLTTRSFEISALQSAMRTARTSSSTRAWQLLPRHARRRAASHNVLRLPSRLRAKGLAELRSSTTLAKTRSAIRKRLPNHPLSISQARKTELRGRAARPGAKWLETHLWISKRFRMSREEFDGDRWGYVLPEEPSMKGEKTDWRASSRVCAIWDASWEGWVRVGVKVAKGVRGKGKEREMDVDGDGSEDGAALQQIKAVELLEQVVRAARLVPSGSVSGEALSFSAASSSSHHVVAYDVTLHGGNEGTNSDRALCPATLYLVRPPNDAATPSNTGQRAGASSPLSSGAGPFSSKPSQQHRRLRPLLSLLPPLPQQSDVDPDAELLIRAHPAAIDVLQRAIEGAVKKVQKAQKTEGEGGKGERRAHLVVKRLATAPADVLVGDEAKRRRGTASMSSESEIKDEKEAPPPSADAMDTDEATSSFSTHRHSAPRSTHLTKQLSHRLSLLRRHGLRSRAFCVFELYGPKSWEVLGKAVQPVRRGGAGDDEEREILQRWAELTAKRASKGKGKEREEAGGSAVEGVPCLSLRVHDPRLGMRRGPPAAAIAASSKKAGGKAGSSSAQHAAVAASAASAAKDADSEAVVSSQVKRKLGDLEDEEDAAVPPSKIARMSQGGHAGSTSSATIQRTVPNLFTDGYDYPRHTKGDLDARRAALLASGTSQATSGSCARSSGSSSGKGRRRGGGGGHNPQPAHVSSFLHPTSSDDVIPIIVVPRSTTSPGGGLTLLIPQGWARPFFYSLLGSSAIPGTGSGVARAIGFAGMRSLTREWGGAWFPDEWPHADALKEKKGEGEWGTAWERSVTFAMEKKREEWLKRPRGKRVNYEKLGVSWPFGGVGMWSACAREGEQALRRMFRAIEGAEQEDKEGNAIPPKKSATATGLHLHGSPLLLRAQIASLRRLLDTTSSPPGIAHKDPLLTRARLLLQRSCHPSSTTSHPLVLLSIETLPNQGGSLEEGDELHLPYNDAAAGPIGALTTGRFSLTRGRSTGMALVSASAWVVAVAAALAKGKQAEEAGMVDEMAAAGGRGEGRDKANQEGNEEKTIAANTKQHGKGGKKKTTSLVKLAEEAFGGDWQSASSEEEWETVRLVVRSIAGGMRREVIARLVRV